MQFINEEQRIALGRVGERSVSGIVHVRGIRAGRTFQFGPVRTHDAARVESLTPIAVAVEVDGIERRQEIGTLRAGPPLLAFAIAPAIALVARALLTRKGR